MPRPTLGKTAMSAAERHARYRAARATGLPVIRRLSSADHRSRAQKWHHAVGQLLDLQAQYAAWRDTMPDNLQDTPTADALNAICDLDLTELLDINPQ